MCVCEEGASWRVFEAIITAFRTSLFGFRERGWFVRSSSSSRALVFEPGSFSRRRVEPGGEAGSSSSSFGFCFRGHMRGRGRADGTRATPADDAREVPYFFLS